VNGKYKDALALEITEIILLPLVLFALSIGGPPLEWVQRVCSLGGYNGKMARLLGGKSQGWSSFRPPFTTVEWSPFVTF
jgi:hypothetical protein